MVEERSGVDLTAAVLDSYLYTNATSSVATAQGASNGVGDMTLGQVRAALRRDDAETDVLRKKVRETENERLGMEMRTLQHRQQQDKMKRQKELDDLVAVREREKESQEREFKAAVEREKLKKRLRSMDESKLQGLREEQQRMIHMLHQEQQALKAQEEKARAHIEELETQLRAEDAKLKERFENLTSATQADGQAREEHADQAQRHVALAQRFGARRTDIQRNQEVLEQQLKESEQERLVKLSKLRGARGGGGGGGGGGAAGGEDADAGGAGALSSAKDPAGAFSGEALDDLVNQMTGEEAMEAAQRNLRDLKAHLMDEDTKYRDYGLNEVERALADEYQRLEGSVPVVKERSDRLQRLVANAPPLLLHEQLKLDNDPQAELDRWLMNERESLLSGKKERMEARRHVDETKPGIAETEGDRAEVHRIRQRSESVLDQAAAAEAAAGQSGGSRSPPRSARSNESFGSQNRGGFADGPPSVEDQSEEAKRHLNSIRMRVLGAGRGATIDREALLEQLEDLERALPAEANAAEAHQRYQEAPSFGGANQYPPGAQAGYPWMGGNYAPPPQQPQQSHQPHQPQQPYGGMMGQPPYGGGGGSDMHMFMWMMQQQQQQQQAAAAAAADAQQAALLRDIEKQAAALEEENSKLQVDIERARYGGASSDGNAWRPTTQRVRELTDKHDEEMARIRYEKEKLEEQAALETLREKLQYEREEKKRMREHEKWLAQQTREIQEQRVQKAKAKEAPMGRDIGSSAGDSIYDPQLGVDVMFDFTGSLPRRLQGAPSGLGKARLIYALYASEPLESDTENSAGVELKFTPYSEVEYSDKQSIGSYSVLGGTALFGKAPEMPVQNGSTVLIELKGKAASPPNAMGQFPSNEREITLGWCFLNLMTSGRLNAGRHCLKFIPGYFHGSKTTYSEAYQRQQSEPGGFAANLYVRIVSAASQPPSQSLDPNLAAHLYTALLPRGASEYQQQAMRQQLQQQLPQDQIAGSNALGSNQAAELAPSQQQQQQQPAESKQPEEADPAHHGYGIQQTMAAKFAGRRWKNAARARRPPAAMANVLRIRSLNLNQGGRSTAFAIGIRFVQATQASPDEDAWVSILGAQNDSNDREWIWSDQRGGNQIELPPDARSAQMRIYEVSVTNTPGPPSKADLGDALGVADVSLSPQPTAGQQTLQLSDVRTNASLGTVLVEFEQSTLPADNASFNGDAEQAIEEENKDALGDVEEEDEEEPLLEIDSNTPEAWLDVDKTPVQRKLFRRGDGFDVYVDGARHLPANASITSVSMKMITSGGILDEELGISSLSPSSTVMNPAYNLVGQDGVQGDKAMRKEYREDDLKDMDSFDPRAILMFKVTTVVTRASLHESRLNAQDRLGGDLKENIKRCVGYALHNCFVNPGDTSGAGLKQPTDSNTREFALNEGLFQIPLAQEPPSAENRTKVLNAFELDDAAHTPCSTLLIRIVKAKKSRDGVSTLTKADYPEEQWAGLGLLDTPPPEGGYLSNAYDSQRSKPKPYERNMYEARRTKQGLALDTRVADVVRESMAQIEPQRQRGSFSDDEMREWIRKQLTDGPPVKNYLDFTTVHPYRPDLGVNIAIDGFFNLEPTAKKEWVSGNGLGATELYKAVFFVTPPAMYKMEPPLTEDAHFTRDLVLDSPASAPRYQDGLITLRNLPFNDSTLLLIEVRCMRKMGKKKKGLPASDGAFEIAPARQGYWTAMPLFMLRQDRTTLEGRGSFDRVATGGYVLPLFKGEIPAEVIALSKSPGQNSVYDWINGRLAQNQKKPGRGEIVAGGIDSMGGVVLRVVDAQIDPVSNKMSRSWVEEVAADPAAPHSIRPKFVYAERVWSKVVKKAKLREASLRQDEVLKILKGAAEPPSGKATKQTIRAQLRKDFPGPGDEAEAICKKCNNEFKEETQITHYISF